MGKHRANISVSPEVLSGMFEELKRRMGFSRSAVLELLVREEAVWTSPEIVDTWMANIELSEGVPWVSNDLPPSSRTKPSVR